MNLPEIFSFPFFFLFFLPPKVSQEDPGIDNGGSAAGTAAGAATARGYGTIPATSGATRTRRFSTIHPPKLFLSRLHSSSTAAAAATTTTTAAAASPAAIPTTTTFSKLILLLRSLTLFLIFLLSCSFWRH